VLRLAPAYGERRPTVGLRPLPRTALRVSCSNQVHSVRCSARLSTATRLVVAGGRSQAERIERGGADQIGREGGRGGELAESSALGRRLRRLFRAAGAAELLRRCWSLSRTDGPGRRAAGLWRERPWLRARSDPRSVANERRWAGSGTTYIVFGLVARLLEDVLDGRIAVRHLESTAASGPRALPSSAS
jgi:hypothetical protein